MSDGPPTEDRAVSTFLDYVALACIFGFVDVLIAGKWLISFGALAAAIIFHIVGIKWPEIKLKVGTRVATGVDRVANDRRYRRSMVVLLVIVGLFFGVMWFRRIHRFDQTKAIKASQLGGSAPPVKIESPTQPERTVVVPSSKPPRQHAQQPLTTEPEAKPGEHAAAPLSSPRTVTPPATATQDQGQVAGAPPRIIPEDPEKAVEAVNRMRNSVTEVLRKKETITFLMSWDDDDSTYLAFVSNVLSSGCRTEPRQCWFTQPANERDLDQPPVRGSGRRGITVHGPDAYALATALGAWFTTYATSTIPPELNSYKEVSTKEIMWVEIGPGSPWKPTTKPPQTPKEDNSGSVGGGITTGPCSNVQVGGKGNTATTNCAPISRVLSESRINKFTKAIGAAKGVLRVVPASSADDVIQLSNQLCDAAIKASWGYSCPTSRNSTMGSDATANGLECYSENWEADDAKAFKSAMAAAQLPCRYIPRAYDFRGVQILGTSGVTILVGSPSS
jgi:hypothetical protein